jgi:hypothetical protein
MWKTYCGTLMPSNDYPFLAIVPTLRSSVEPQGMTAVTGYLIIDNFGSSGACTNPDQQ